MESPIRNTYLDGLLMSRKELTQKFDLRDIKVIKILNILNNLM